MLAIAGAAAAQGRHGGRMRAEQGKRTGVNAVFAASVERLAESRRRLKRPMTGKGA